MHHYPSVTTIVTPRVTAATTKERTSFRTNFSLGLHGYIQLFRERLSEKVHATIPKGNMGYDQSTFPDTVAVEPTFIAFL